MDSIIAVAHKCCPALLVIIRQFLLQRVKMLFAIQKRQTMMTAFSHISLIAFKRPR
uniref:Uncharacterized protein n=1 Tax=Hyaloperonospora arabidopsidis (strain Emoy2) TaxID=559515 RepID=M4BJC5_HYAAE